MICKASSSCCQDVPPSLATLEIFQVEDEATKQMRKRLRKKLYLKEFQEMGFCVRFSHSEDVEVFFNETIDFFEANNWNFCGRCSYQWDGFIGAFGRYSLTDGDRERLKDWLNSKETVVEIKVGKLADCWYGPFDDYEE